MNGRDLPLMSIESEQSVIGALLLDNASVDRITTPLAPEHFARDDHRLIYRAIQRLTAAGRPADVVTVFEALEQVGEAERAGGLAYLGEIANNTPSAANIRRYAEIVRERAQLRALATVGDEIVVMVADPTMSLEEKLQAAQAKVMAIAEAGAGSRYEPQHIRHALMRHTERIEAHREGLVTDLPTGFAAVDKMLNGGLRPGQLVILAARPGMGKTSFAMQVAHHAAGRGAPALVCSQEMSEADIIDRVIAASHGIPLEALVSGELNDEGWSRYAAALATLHTLPLFIDDQPAMALLDVVTKARKVRRTAGSLGLVVIDYLQLMSGTGDNRNAELERISRGLKQLAKELAVPVLALSQLSRECEKRPNKRPMTSDLRDSGAIEQDADVILALYQDVVYNPDSPDAGTAEVLVRKNRQGRIGEARLSWRGECAAFGNLDMDTWQAQRRQRQEQPASDNHRFSQRRKGFDG